MKYKIYLLFFITSLSVNANAFCEKDWGNNYTCKTDGRTIFIGKMSGEWDFLDGTFYYEGGDEFTGTYYKSGVNKEGLFKYSGGDTYKGTFYKNGSKKEGLFKYSDGDTYKGTYSYDGLRDIGIFKFAYDSGEVKHLKTVTYKGHDIKVTYRNTGIKYIYGEATHQTLDIIISVTGDHYVSIPTKTINIKTETIDGEFDYAEEQRKDFKIIVSSRILFTREAINREIYILKSNQPDYTYEIVESFTQFSNLRKKNTFKNNKNKVLQVIIDKSKNTVKVAAASKVTKHTKYTDLEDQGLFCEIGKITSVCEGALNKNDYLKYEFNHVLGSLRRTRKMSDATYVSKFKSK